MRLPAFQSKTLPVQLPDHFRLFFLLFLRFFDLQPRLTPIIPVDPRNAPVSPIIPVHTQKQGGTGYPWYDQSFHFGNALTSTDLRSPFFLCALCVLCGKTSCEGHLCLPPGVGVIPLRARCIQKAQRNAK